MFNSYGSLPEGNNGGNINKTSLGPWGLTLAPLCSAQEKTYEAFKGFVSQLIADAAKEVTF
jgi:hypothetical protein